MADFDFDVVVCGYGLAGLSLASVLSRLGHRVCVLEKFPSLYGAPRLISVDGEGARILQAAGDIDRSLRVSAVPRHYSLLDADRELITRVDWRGLHMCGFAGRICFYQPDAEQEMDEAARARGAEVNQGWEVISADQDASGVTVVARKRNVGYGGGDTPSRSIRARYLVGADGARSFIRETFGFEREDFGFQSAFLSVDCDRLKPLPQLDQPFSICDPGRNITYIPIGRKRMRFEFVINPGDDHNELLVPEVGYDFLAQAWGLTREDVSIYRQVIYKFEGKLAPSWRKGRVFLAGDAAHLMPPFLGQGGCAALRDSINLAWKMHLVLGGVSDEALLDTYQAERKPHVRVHIEGSIALGRLACETDPLKAAERDRMYRAGEMPPPPPDPTLVGGVLYRDENGELGRYAGELMEQGIVKYRGEIGRFDDVVGWGFHLIGWECDPLATLNAEQRAFLESIGCAAITVGHDPDVEGALEIDRAYEAFFTDRESMRAVISRPDFYIFGAVWDLDDLPAIVESLRAQLFATKGSGDARALEHAGDQGASQ